MMATFCCSLCALDVTDIENVHVKNRTRYVSDMASAMSPQARIQADSLLSAMWRLSSAEPVVVIINSLDGEEINDFATRLFSHWGIGKKDKDNGVLMLISIDDRKAVIRTGYGVEGLLPDVIAARIIHNDMSPYFRKADYDSGILAALQTMGKVLTSDEAREELMSAHANDADASNSDEDFFSLYLLVCMIMGIGMLTIVIVMYASARKLPTAEAYARLQPVKLIGLMATVLFLGAPLPAYLLLIFFMRHIRLHKRLCPNCGTRMQRVDEDNDNLYLTSSQDAEERLNSVDYDVWLCSQCGETDIIPYVNTTKNFTECPVCHARACSLVSQRTIIQPTEYREGRGVQDFVCQNCRKHWQKPYNIAKVVAPPVIITGGGGRGFGGGGGFGGGSFGGGMTGGGGASGGW